MRALYLHISGLVGLLVFLREVLNYAPLERTILVATTTGLTVYLMLIVGHTIVQHIMAYSPPDTPNKQKPKRAVPGMQPSSAPSGPAPSQPAVAETDAARNATDDAATESSSPTDSSAEAPPEDGTDTEPAPAADASAPDGAPPPEAEETESEPVAQTPA